MSNWRQIEKLHRSRILAIPFTLTNLLTKFEIHGKEHLEQAIERSKRTGRGIITISNHQSLFDDPLILQTILGIKDFTLESKAWWSTPCKSNFNPAGKSFSARFVRYFSEVANMVFFERPAKKGGVLELPHSYLEALNQRCDAQLLDRIMDRAAELGTGGESLLRTFITEGNPIKMAPLNQTGMIEACARIMLGDWLHFFPEGGRSRTASLRPPRRGVGKALYCCPDAEVIPFAFCGMHDVMPINKAFPRPMQKVVVKVGKPVSQAQLQPLRAYPQTPETFAALTATAWSSVQSLFSEARALQGTPVPEEEQVDRGRIVVEHAKRMEASQAPNAKSILGDSWALTNTPVPRRIARM